MYASKKNRVVFFLSNCANHVHEFSTRFYSFSFLWMCHWTFFKWRRKKKKSHILRNLCHLMSINWLVHRLWNHSFSLRIRFIECVLWTINCAVHLSFSFAYSNWPKSINRKKMLVQFLINMQCKSWCCHYWIQFVNVFYWKKKMLFNWKIKTITLH